VDEDTAQNINLSERIAGGYQFTDDRLLEDEEEK
jgi:hypothetical protein